MTVLILKIIASLISALLLWASFPPAQEGNSVWLALVPILLLIRHCGARESFKWVFLAALGFWVMTLSWFPAIIKNGGPWFLVILGQVALAAVCALFAAVFAWVSASLWQRCGEGASLRRIGMILLIDPLLWVGTEYVRGTLFSGFAWNFLGVSQVNNSVVIQLAAIGGVYAVSALIIMVNGALASIVERAGYPFVCRLLRCPFTCNRERLPGRLIKSCESFIPLLCAIAALHYGLRRIQRWQAVQSEQPQWNIVLVQPNTPCVFINNDETMQRQLDYLLESAERMSVARPDLVIWPETTLPGSVPHDAKTMSFVNKAVRVAGAALLTGTLEVERVEKSATAPQGLRFYNAAWMFAADGSVLGRYRKQHLVPFGEYIPFDKRIPILQKLAPTGVSCTPGDGPALIELQNRSGKSMRIGSLICFEDTVPALSRKSVGAGADLLALMTNDAWFNGSVEPLQHLNQSVFRAVECGVPLVRSANSGVSCVVDCVGRVNRLTVAGETLDVAGVWMVPVRVPQKLSPTPYVRWGDWLLALPGLFVLLSVTGWILIKRRIVK